MRHIKYISDHNLIKEYMYELKPTRNKTIKHFSYWLIIILVILLLPPIWGRMTWRMASYLRVTYILAFVVIFLLIFFELLYRSNYKLFLKNIRKIE
jgi:hypothetical protein